MLFCRALTIHHTLTLSFHPTPVLPPSPSHTHTPSNCVLIYQQVGALVVVVVHSDHCSLTYTLYQTVQPPLTVPWEMGKCHLCVSRFHVCKKVDMFHVCKKVDIYDKPMLRLMWYGGRFSVRVVT